MNDQGMFDFEGEYVEEERSRLIPWVIVGAIAVVAILISILVINVMNSGMGNITQPTNPPTSSESPVPTTGPTGEPTAQPTPEPTTSPTPTQSPETEWGGSDAEIDTSGVVVGSVYPVDVEHEGWGVTIHVPNKLNNWTYRLEGADRELLVLDSDLFEKLPSSCNHLKNQWGIERVGDGEFVPFTPNEMCAENEALYIEILGLVKTIAPSITPLTESDDN